MKTSDGWTVKRVKNPHPKKWTGPWFQFILEGYHSDYGMANWQMLKFYIGDNAWEEVKKVYAKTLKKVLDIPITVVEGREENFEIRCPVCNHLLLDQASDAEGKSLDYCEHVAGAWCDFLQEFDHEDSEFEKKVVSAQTEIMERENLEEDWEIEGKDLIEILVRDWPNDMIVKFIDGGMLCGGPCIVTTDYFFFKRT